MISLNANVDDIDDDDDDGNDQADVDTCMLTILDIYLVIMCIGV